VEQVTERRAELADARDALSSLDSEVDQGQADALNATASGRTLSDRITALGVDAGTVEVTGPGIRIEVDDSPEADTDKQVVLDTDLQIMVNGLWASGAEAIAINGQRLTNLSSIRVAGEAITVNLRSLVRPYVVRAIGDPDDLGARFIESDGGVWWLNLKAVYGLQFSLSTEESLTLPAAQTPQLRHAGPVRTEGEQ